MLEVKSLNKTFTGSDGSMIQPVKDLTFSLDEGTCLGIAGPSGVGKSSILKCIYRTYLSSKGSIHYQSQQQGWVDLVSASERQIILCERKKSVMFLNF
ncbi:ATP-binding cassette domain-containing protein [Thalassobacillus sp. C254]|uniref:ATP-binding cassette domain-containing protein n=1 Tax=Thalassobacillus sp. C254 TaxID=1225341 RepID=UPI0006D1C67F|nr:ATP-binding cassette domain-containing protein [Thalassobacillus sp. C254]